ncbi:MAG: sigma-70 family RNA polymerase sigma factor [Clostridia bacterium]|nr:sigma-70 family RNA polymerase sigma factor [Clostridia bacterium]
MMDAGQIYREYQPKVRAYVRSKIQDPHDAEDLVSAVFMKVVQKLDCYDPARASISTWVYTITRNTVTDFYRTRRSMVAFEDYMLDEAPAMELTDDALDCLAEALLSLKERERDLTVLHYYSGHTLKTVAEMMGMSYINAKVIHKKALASLRAFYAAG